jgi:hypothetical protein
MGLCFESPPPGFVARYVSPVDPRTLTTPSWSWIYHLPNNYAKNREKPFAKTRTDRQFGPEERVAAWRPASKFNRCLALLRGKKRFNGPEPSL